MELKDRIAIVTGGAHGIGRALCRALRNAGAQVVVADIDGQAAVTLAAEIGGLGLAADVSREADIIAAIEACEAQLGPVDLFVSNAGVGFGDGPGGAASAPDAHWRSCLDINLMAHVYAARALIPRFRRRGGGCLVNVASAAGLLSQIGEAAYTASKHAAVAFAESLAITHGDEGVQVCLVCPQAVATRMTGFDDDGRPLGDTGFGGNDVDGILRAETVADCILEAVREGRFLVLPHPQVATYYARRAGDTDRWVEGMRRFRQRLAADEG